MSCGRVIDGICPGSSGGNAGLAENIDGGDVGDIATQSNPGATVFSSPGVAGTVFTSNGVLALPSFQNISNSTNTTNINGGSIGSIIKQISPNTTGFITPITSGTVLTSNGVLTSPSFQTVSQSTNTTNVTGGNTGSIIYQTALDTTGFIAPGTSGGILTSNGSLTAPSFQPVVTPFTSPTVTKYTSGSGTFTPAVGCKYIKVYMVGGGGGGGGTFSDQASGGGGGGAFACVRLAAASYSYSVGTGGAGGAFNVNGSAGTASTFSTFTANAGNGGFRNRTDPFIPATGAVISGTTATNALHFESGGNGGNIHYYNTNTSYYFGGYGGSSKFGGETKCPIYNNASIPGTVPGRGGSGAVSSGSTSGGDGGPGQIIVVSYFE